MLKKSLYVSLFSLFLATTFVACGLPTDEELGSSDQQLIPSWLKHIPTNWGCDQTLKGKFNGWDKGHMYSFPGKVGYEYTFSFQGGYPAYQGAAIAVYDAQTTKRVAFAKQSFGNSVKLVYKAQSNVKYLVAVYALVGYPHGNYKLGSVCKKTQYCVLYETKDAVTGVPYRNFYAKNVNSYEEGKKHLAQVIHFLNESINEGTCYDGPLACPAVYKPVCATSSNPAPTTYSNLCGFKAQVRKEAGTTGESKGHWDEGACNPEGQFCGGIAGIPCPEGFNCVLDGNYPDAGGKCTAASAEGKFCGGIAGIQCPKGYKCILDGDYPDAGGKCKKVSCTVDGNEYAAGEGFPSSDGCNVCSCTERGVAICTKRACLTCNPQTEYNRKYVATDSNQCSLIRFMCEPNTTYFSNSCGCGCEQDASCPEWINCMPSPTGNNCAALRTKCPFSQVAY